MSKTKNEIELEIRVKALEDTLYETIQIIRDHFPTDLPDVAEHKVWHFEQMKAKYPELGIEYPK